jgi:hypothetical protein
MPHSDPGVEAARDDIHIAAAASLSRMGGRNKTAEQMARQVDRDERREAAGGEDAVERP